MKKVSFIALFILLFSFIQCSTSFAQNYKYINLDNIEYKAIYKSTKIDITNNNSVSTTNMILLIGSKMSKFMTRGAYAQDSLYKSVDIKSLSPTVAATHFRDRPARGLKTMRRKQ